MLNNLYTTFSIAALRRSGTTSLSSSSRVLVEEWMQAQVQHHPDYVDMSYFSEILLSICFLANKPLFQYLLDEYFADIGACDGAVLNVALSSSNSIRECLDFGV